MPRPKKKIIKPKVTPYRRKPIQLFNRSKKFEARTLTARRLVVVGNAVQKAKLREKKAYGNALVLTAEEIASSGVFGIDIIAVTWVGGWALECESPETVCERVAQRLRACKYEGGL